jgi:hypothetical protein
LVRGSPQTILLAVDLDEDLVDIEGVTIAPMSSFQLSRIFGTELDTPEPDSFVTDSDASFSQEIFDTSMAEIEAIVQPDCITDDIGRESVAFVGGHPPSLAIVAG